MSKINNFNLVEAEHRGALTLFRDYDTDNDETSILGAHAGMMNFLYIPTGVSFPEGEPIFSGGHVDNPDITKYLYFAFELNLTETPPPDVNHFFISNLSVTGCEAVATLPDGSVIGTASQIENFIYMKLSAIGGLSSIKVAITFPYAVNFDSDSNIRLRMSPPFFGGSDIAKDSKVCYSWGAGVEIGEALQYQQSGNQAFEIEKKTFRKKTIPIEAANLSQLGQLIAFFRSDKRKLTLTILDGGKTRESFYYGPSNATRSTQNKGNLNTLDITTRDKFAEDYSL